MKDSSEIRKHYTINISEGKVDSVLVEAEDRFYRALYKRNPAGMELPLPEVLFEEAVKRSLCDNGIMKLEEFYCTIRNTDPHYAEIVKRVYKKYIQSVIFKTCIHQDAFWS